MLANVWRAALAVADVERNLRAWEGRPCLDVVFVTNIRDEAERQRFFSARADRSQHASGPRIYLGDVAGAVRGINATAEEMYSRDGRKRAKRIFIEAVEWAEDQGAATVLLAASTKRLFGRDGAELKARFPHLLFTIGDNGTALLLCRDIDRALAAAGLVDEKPRILVIGPYGILGREVSRHLQAQGHNVVGFGATAALAESFAAETGMPMYTDLSSIGRVDMVVACTHSAEAKLSPNDVDMLRRPGRRLLVVDVAEPANLDAAAYAQRANVLVRQDAGNARSPNIHYVLGPLSWSKLHLARRTAFGCFAEALALHHGVYKESRIDALSRDWFEVSARNQAWVAERFRTLDVDLPWPHCFGQQVRSFDLNLRTEAQRVVSSAAALAGV